MDKETKISLDNIVKQLQGFISIERKKAGTQNKQKMKDYLVPIYLINQEFKTNYSIEIEEIEKYPRYKLPLEE